MKTLVCIALVSFELAFFIPSLVVAGERCRHDTCGTVCRVYVIDSHRRVAEVSYREIKVKVPRKTCETRLVEEKSLVVKPVYQRAVEPGCATVAVPRRQQVVCLETRRESQTETVMKSVTVDAGEWATMTRSCGLCGPIVCEHVWVPKYVETKVPSTELVYRDVVVPRVHEKWHDVPCTVDFPIQTTNRKLESEEVVRHVPVTTEKWVEEEVVIKVPFVTWRCVSCRQVFETPDDRSCNRPGCSERCHHKSDCGSRRPAW